MKARVQFALGLSFETFDGDGLVDGGSSSQLKSVVGMERSVKWNGSCSALIGIQSNPMIGLASALTSNILLGVLPYV